jgi:hypothetical protein
VRFDFDPTDFDDRDDFAFTVFDECELPEECFADRDDDARRASLTQLARARLDLADAFPRFTAAQRTGLIDLFHPISRSARNLSGMSRIPPSTTASTAASDRSARTSAMTFPGCAARAAWTRLVSSTTNISRSGSIHIDVPVNQVWP